MDEIKCIIAIVERGKADKIVNKAKKSRSKRSYDYVWKGGNRANGSIKVF